MESAPAGASQELGMEHQDPSHVGAGTPGLWQYFCLWVLGQFLPPPQGLSVLMPTTRSLVKTLGPLQPPFVFGDIRDVWI